MALRASSLQSTNTLAINREIGSQYDVILDVSKHLAEIDTLANADISGLINSLNDAKDFTGITVVTGETPSWDAANKILTVPVEKGDTGENGRGIVDIELTNTVGLTKTYAINYTDGTSSTFTVINGANGTNGVAGKSVYQLWLDAGNEGTLNEFLEAMKGPEGNTGPQGIGIQGPAGIDGRDLTVEQISYDGNGVFTWQFSDGTSYTTPDLRGPQGATGQKGDKGDQGIGVHHMKGTSTTDPEGNFSTVGELDTYTFYADADEKIPLAWFTVKNGENPWLRAIDKGYRGTEEEFYIMLGAVEAYAAIALESINITEENKQFVIAQAQIVAADKLIVEQNMNTTISNREQSDLVLEHMNSILLGNKASDPSVDNNGDTLTIGSMYFNTTENVLKVWSGIKWYALTFSFNGRAGEVVLLNSDVTSAVGRDVADALSNIDLAIANEVSKTNSHIADINNPHSVTKDQVGLGNVDNTKDSVKNVLSATKLTTARTINGVSFDGTSSIVVSDDTKIPISDKGAVNGVATLGANGKIAASQLPSYVDDVLEVNTYADLPVVGESGKIYVVIADETSNGDTSTYRWAGTIYAMVSNTLNASDVKALYEANADTNAYTDAEKVKLGITETSSQLDARDTANRDRNNHTGTQLASTISDFDTAVAATVQVTANTTKLLSIEDGATADQTAEEIEVLYESNVDTNKYTDAEKARVDISTGLATVAQTLPEAVNELDGRLADKVDTTTLDGLNVFRADKVLASKDVANLIYSNGNLVKIRYTNDTDVDYEVLSYVGDDLTNVAHYVGGVLQGNTVLTYSGGDLVSSIFIGV